MQEWTSRGNVPSTSRELTDTRFDLVVTLCAQRAGALSGVSSARHACASTVGLDDPPKLVEQAGVTIRRGGPGSLPSGS